MGFLQRFLPNNLRETHPTRDSSSFANLSEEQLEKHLMVARYGDFMLTEAVRPSFESKEVLLDLFIDLLQPMGTEVDVVLETSHECDAGSHHDLYREHIDLPVLQSILYDFEDLILDDGCAGIAVLNPKVPVEVQLDEHKLLIIYGRRLQEFEQIFADYKVDCNEDIRFITEAEHVHSSSEEFQKRFESLRYRLGIDE
jgi:hypothetical protein